MSQPKQNKLYESMLFEYGTTQRTDYKEGSHKPAPDIPPVFPKIKHRRELSAEDRLTAVKFVGTMTEYKRYLPFDLLIKPKPITQTDPTAIQKPYSKIVDEEKLEVRRTRPRITMPPPAISLDDIDDEEIRQTLIEDEFTTSGMNAMMLDAAMMVPRCIVAPLPDMPGPADPLKYIPLKPPYVPREWRKQSTEWDRRQVRSYCSPTKEFWLDRDKHEATSKEPALPGERKKQPQQFPQAKMHRHPRYP